MGFKETIDLFKKKVNSILVNISSKSLKELKGFLLQEKDTDISWARIVDENLLEHCYVFDSETNIGYGVAINSESESLWI